VLPRGIADHRSGGRPPTLVTFVNGRVVPDLLVTPLDRSGAGFGDRRARFRSHSTPAFRNAIPAVAEREL